MESVPAAGVVPRFQLLLILHLRATARVRVAVPVQSFWEISNSFCCANDANDRYWEFPARMMIYSHSHTQWNRNKCASIAPEERNKYASVTFIKYGQYGPLSPWLSENWIYSGITMYYARFGVKNTWYSSIWSLPSICRSCLKGETLGFPHLLPSGND